MRIEVRAFAGLRELLEGSERSLELMEGARVRDAWAVLVKAHPGLDEASGSTRVARNGRLTALDEPLADGDELALLPPVGGG
ncbi:MAG: MoaD/ThiS family protein [Candidatus Baltobacteraceae bacterium]